MDYTTLTPPAVALSEEEVPQLAPALSLYETFQHLPDPRRGQGKRYDLALLLCLLVLAKLAGQTSLKGATEWIRHRADTLAAHFGLKRKQWLPNAHRTRSWPVSSPQQYRVKPDRYPGSAQYGPTSSLLRCSS